MRLLTLICFFNFCGLNNGTVYAFQALPAESAPSVTMAAQAVRAGCRYVHPIAFGRSVQRICVALSLKMQRQLRQAARWTAASFYFSPNFSSGLNVQAGSRPGQSAQAASFGKETNVEAHQESYSKKEQETWLQSKRETGSPLSLIHFKPLLPELNRSLLGPVNAGRLFMQSARMRRPERRLFYSDGSAEGDASPAVLAAPALRAIFHLNLSWRTAPMGSIFFQPLQTLTHP